MTERRRIDHGFLQEVAEESARRHGIVGAVAAVFDGTEQVEVATGLANLETGAPVTPDTLFQIGSTTKMYTAALVMSLVDEGRIDLDEPVQSYLGDDVRLAADDPGTITCRHLLSMSAGIENGSYAAYGRGDDALTKYVAALADVRMVAPPGELFGYSNAATNVAGLVAERVTGSTWEDALTERILAPAGLQSSLMHAEDIIHRPFSVGHVGDEEGNAQVLHFWALPRSLAPAGATLCTSIGDLVRFGRLFLDKGGDVLSPSAVEAMQTPQVDVPFTGMADKWGIGPYWKVWDGHVFHGHSGTNSGGSSTLLWCPSLGIAMAVVVNTPRHGYPFAEDVFGAVLREGFGVTKPKYPEGDPSIEFDADAFVGTYASPGARIEVRVDDEGLELHAKGDAGNEGESMEITSRLVPVSPTCFRPDNPLLTGGRGLGVAFVGSEGGRATHYLNFVFLSRRSDES